MKVFIWISTFFVGAIINTLIGYATGIKFGAVLLFIIEYFIARKLCELWDNRLPKVKAEAPDSTNASTATSVSITETSLKKDTYTTTEETSTTESMVSTETDEIESEPVPDRPLFCRKCGAKLFEDSMFCNKCGTQIKE